MAATYNLSTAVGKCRLYAADTNIVEAIFDDDEWQVFLDDRGGNVFLAAADGLEAMAADASKVAVVMKNDVNVTDPTKMAQQLADRAIALRSRAATSSGATQVVATDRVFVPAQTAIASQSEAVDALAGGNQDPW